MRPSEYTRPRYGQARKLKPSLEVFGMFSKLPTLSGKKEDIAVVRETLLNDEWLNSKSLSTGTVSYGNSTFILKDYGKSFTALKGAYEKCVNGNLQKIKEFQNQLGPFEKFIEVDPNRDDPKLIDSAKALKAPKLAATPLPTTEEVPKPDKAGLKALAQVYVDILSDRTNLASVESALELLQEDWYGVKSKYRSKTRHDTDGDLIVRTVAGKIGNMWGGDTYIEYQSKEGYDRAKGHLITDLIKLFKATL